MAEHTPTNYADAFAFIACERVDALSVASSGANFANRQLIVEFAAKSGLPTIKETIPEIAEVGVLLNPDNPVNGPLLQVMEDVANSMKVTLRKLDARGPKEFDATFSAMINQGIGGIVINDDAVFLAPSPLASARSPRRLERRAPR